MAKKSDIDSDITLEINGDLPSPRQIADAITALSTLLSSAHKKVEGGKSIKFGIQVKKGSNLFEYVPQNTSYNPAALSVVANGIKSLSKGDVCPAGFDDSMLYNLQTIASIVESKEKQRKSVRLWVNKKPLRIDNSVKSNLDSVLEGAFSEYGVVEGLLEVLNAHDGMEFTIYEPLYSKRIKCLAAESDIFSEAYRYYEQRVEAEGMIKYSGRGIPYEIRVERLAPLVKGPLPDYRLTRGILKPYV